LAQAFGLSLSASGVSLSFGMAETLPLLKGPGSVSSGTGSKACNSKLGGIVCGNRLSPEQYLTYIHTQPRHIFDQLGDYFKLDASEPAVEVAVAEGSEDSLQISPTARKDPRPPLYATIVVQHVKGVNTSANTFEMKVRVLLMWEVDLSVREDFKEWRDDASAASNGYRALSGDEITMFSEVVDIPTVGFVNAMQKEDADVLGLRIYRRVNEDSLDMVMWNMAYLITFRQNFPLHDMPFDRQHLELQFEMDNAATWNKYHMTLVAYIIAKEAQHVNEFDLLVPSIQKETDSDIMHRRKTIIIPLTRHWQYYMYNIVSVCFMLSFFAQLIFSCSIDAVDGRLGLVVTLFLTVVAFKFTLDLPKLNYITTMDSYILKMMFALFLSGIFVCVAKKMGDLQKHGLLLYSLDWLEDEKGLYWLDWHMSILNAVVSAWVHLQFVFRAIRYEHRQETMKFKADKKFLCYHFARPFFFPSVPSQ